MPGTTTSPDAAGPSDGDVSEGSLPANDAKIHQKPSQTGEPGTKPAKAQITTSSPSAAPPTLTRTQIAATAPEASTVSAEVAAKPSAVTGVSTAVPTVHTTPLVAAEVATPATQPVLAASATAVSPSPLAELSKMVSTVLNPLLAPVPNAPEPFGPILWSVLAFVRRNLLPQAPTVTYNQSLDLQTGEVVTGTIGATNPYGDKMVYTVTQQPQNGTVTVNQTGAFNYTPSNAFDVTGGPDSFTVSVTDPKFSLVAALLGKKLTTSTSVGVTVRPPSVTLSVVPLPNTITTPEQSQWAANGTSLLFNAKPAVDGVAVAGVRSEIYQVNPDGTDLQCLTCGVSTSITQNLSKPFAFTDGSGRVLVRVGTQNPNQSASNAIYEPATATTAAELAPVVIPASASAYVIQADREMRIAPDGVHIAFSQVLADPAAGYVSNLISVVGSLQRTTDVNGDPEYQIVDPRVVYGQGELKGFTPDGQSVVVSDFTGKYSAGNADDVAVNLATGAQTRITTNLDYDEETFYSPNEQWLVVGSARTQNIVTAMSQIQRPTFVPAYIVGALFASNLNTINQPFLNSVQGELAGETGIPLFDPTSGYDAEPAATFNPAGTEITYWASKEGLLNATNTELVVGQLTNLNAGNPAPTKTGSPDPTWAPPYGTYKPVSPALPGPGSYAGQYGGTAVVTVAPNPTTPGTTITTVTYHDYQDVQGQVLNGNEQTNTNATYTNIAYTASVLVTNPSGGQIGDLQANATVVNSLTMTGTITSTLNGAIDTITNGMVSSSASQSV